MRRWGDGEVGAIANFAQTGTVDQNPQINSCAVFYLRMLYKVMKMGRWGVKIYYPFPITYCLFPIPYVYCFCSTSFTCTC